jgi:toxin CptA
LAGLFSALGWWYVILQLDWRIALAFLSVLMAGVAARTSWINLPSGQLAWNGEVWRWESASYQTGVAEQELVVIADFQRWLLLRLENQARASLWLWAEQSAMPDRWLDLRRAVYSPHRSPSAPAQHDLPLAESPPSALTPSAMAVSIPMHSVNAPQAKP